MVLCIILVMGVFITRILWVSVWVCTARVVDALDVDRLYYMVLGAMVLSMLLVLSSILVIWVGLGSMVKIIWVLLVAFVVVGD